MQDLMIRIAQHYQQAFNVPESQASAVMDGVENCVCKNLYNELFYTFPEEQDLINNELIASQIAKFRNFVLPRHLELKNARITEERIHQTTQLLDKLDSMKTPKGKLNIVINLSKVLSVMLAETTTKEERDGADLFFPSVIYAILQANNVMHLQTNLIYIRCFRVEIPG